VPLGRCSEGLAWERAARRLIRGTQTLVALYLGSIGVRLRCHMFYLGPASRTLTIVLVQPNNTSCIS